jgi:hypothetical protein
MRRALFCLGVCLAAACLILTGYAPAAPGPANDPSASPPSGRKAWEALLRAPARLDFGSRSTVTMQEVLDQLHKQHHLSYRFDVPTLTGSLGQEVTGAPSPVFYTPQSSGAPQYAPTALIAAPAAPILSVTVGTPQVVAAAPDPVAVPVVAPPPVAVVQPVTQTENPIPATNPPAAAAPTAVVLSPAVPVSPAVFSPPVKPVDATSISATFSKVEVNIQNFDTQGASIATILRHTFDALPVEMGEIAEAFGGLPITLTNASLVDYLVEDDGLLITSRMNALTVKETRVYSIKHLRDLTPEQLAAVIPQSIRPWSWRSHINDLGSQLKAGMPKISAETTTAWITTAAQMVSETTGIDVEIADDETVPRMTGQPPTAAATEVDFESVVNGLIALGQASISALEMVHFSDPPTGTIETLPGKLVITQSQAAHREIADLLEQLSAE